MSSVKISELGAATSLQDADLFVIVQGGTSKKITADNVFSSADYAKVIVFTAVAAQNSYTASDVPNLSRLVGKEIGTEIFKVEDDGSDLLTSSALVTWNDTTFTISNAVTISGGEKIIIWYY